MILLVIALTLLPVWTRGPPLVPAAATVESFVDSLCNLHHFCPPPFSPPSVPHSHAPYNLHRVDHVTLVTRAHVWPSIVMSTTGWMTTMVIVHRRRLTTDAGQ